MIEGESRTSGLVIHKGPNGQKRNRHLDLHAGLLELPCDPR